MNVLACSRMLRWWRFNLVGAMGLAVQLATLAVMNRLLLPHYLLAASIAVEFAILHNFVWHVRYTWRDRRGGASTQSQLLRFHLSNGLVSLLGNIALMRLLVAEAHLPVVAANLAASLCCATINFCLGDSWAFPVKT